jgi:hypothetical protein
VKRFLNIYLILILGAALRILFAFKSLGFEHPNENYRLLEPLAYLQGYSVRLPWEWTEGLLSKTPLFFHYFYISLLAHFGVTSALGQLIGLRLLYGMLSLFQIVAAYRITLRTCNSRAAAGVSALIVAVWPEIVYRSVRLMDYSLEASMLSIALILIFTTHRRHREIYLCFAGVVLGSLFFVRFQSGMYFVAIMGVLVFMKPKRLMEAANFAGFYGLTVLFFAVIEARGFTHLLAPFFKYIDYNVFENGAQKFYGSEPWHRYFSELAKSYGFFPVIIFIYSLIRFKTDTKIVMIFLFPFLVLSLVAHKEARFIYGFVWLMVPLTVASVDLVQNSKTYVYIASAFFLIGFVINGARIYQRYDEGTAAVLQWSQAGDELSEDPASSKIPLYVYGDPDFLPGGFFLRFSGPICYKYDNRRQGMCLKSVSEFRTLRLRNASGELATSTEAATWWLSPLQKVESKILPPADLTSEPKSGT